jgi:hypothetical protein
VKWPDWLIDCIYWALLVFIGLMVALGAYAKYKITKTPIRAKTYDNWKYRGEQ